MPDFYAPIFWKTQWEFVMNAPWIIIPMLLVVAFVAWRARGAVDDGEVRGLRAHKDTLEAQLRQAREQNVGETQKITSIQKEIGELRQLIKANAQPAILERAASTVESTASELALSHNATHYILKAGPGTYTLSGGKISSTQNSV